MFELFILLTGILLFIVGFLSFNAVSKTIANNLKSKYEKFGDLSNGLNIKDLFDLSI